MRELLNCLTVWNSRQFLYQRDDRFFIWNLHTCGFRCLNTAEKRGFCFGERPMCLFADVYTSEQIIYVNSLYRMVVAINQGNFAKAYNIGTGQS